MKTRPHRKHSRQRGPSSPFQIAPTVAKALHAHRAVVGLETSVIAHGLPSPDGVEAAHRCEVAVREEGAIPATIGIVGGRIMVGLDSDQIARLGDTSFPTAKAGERDLAALCSSGAWAGTTVSATCAIAVAAGIRIVATGGIGGVHRAIDDGFDISSDLATLARSPVAVVCSGAKAVLDVPRTVEALEALSVLVLGFGTSQFPNFYCAESGIPVEHIVDSPEGAAKVLRLRFETLRQGGALVVQPPPEGGLPRGEVERAVVEAMARLKGSDVRGKGTTPFLLGEVDRITGGASRRVNLALLEANARLAARIAVAYAGGSR
jgi:pseudouridine-5'-phosphate glycosidase